LPQSAVNNNRLKCRGDFRIAPAAHNDICAAAGGGMEKI